jgi:hypothetical protein
VIYGKTLLGQEREGVVGCKLVFAAVSWQSDDLVRVIGQSRKIRMKDRAKRSRGCVDRPADQFMSIIFSSSPPSCPVPEFLRLVTLPKHPYPSAWDS